MARYKALRAGYPNKQVEIGEEFDFDGVPGSWMQPVDAAAKKAFAARFGEDAEAKGEPELSSFPSAPLPSAIRRPPRRL